MHAQHPHRMLPGHPTMWQVSCRTMACCIKCASSSQWHHGSVQHMLEQTTIYEQTRLHSCTILCGRWRRADTHLRLCPRGGLNKDGTRPCLRCPPPRLLGTAISLISCGCKAPDAILVLLMLGLAILPMGGGAAIQQAEDLELRLLGGRCGVMSSWYSPGVWHGNMVSNAV